MLQIRKGLLIIGLIGLLPVWVHAADFYPPFVPQPGTLAARQGMRVHDVARNWADNLPVWYYKVHGVWPESWQAIVDAGLFSAELTGIHGEAIAPDDRRLDFAGDIQDMYKGPQTPPVIAFLSESKTGGKRVRYDRLALQPAYSATFAAPLPGLSGAANLKRRELADDRTRRLQLAVMQEYSYAQGLHLTLYDRYGTWEELHRRGLAPLRPGTLNPLTGRPWRGDGSADDLDFACSADGRQCHCVMTDSAGSTPWQVS